MAWLRELERNSQIPTITSSRVSPQGRQKKTAPLDGNKRFWQAAIASLALGVLSVVPYTMILDSDPGSPIFISFVTHVFFVIINVQVVPSLFRERKIPLSYHVGFVVFGFLQAILQSDATKRLPTSVAMALLNLQILVGVIVEAVAFGRRYSLSKLFSCAAVTAGVALAGRAAKSQSESGVMVANTDVLLGTTEMVGALLAFTLHSITVKTAFDRYGENVGEQMFTQHLGSLPLFLIGGQWDQIGPRVADWGFGADRWKALLLLGNIALTFGDRAASSKMAGRAPDVLLVQLVETLKRFLILLLTALLAAPPLPPVGFWMGAAVLAGGTVQFVLTSDDARTGEGAGLASDGHTVKSKIQ